jgi:hypothetical protein
LRDQGEKVPVITTENCARNLQEKETGINPIPSENVKR